MRKVDVAERRARLAVRHRLASPADDVVEAAQSVVGLHGTDPVSVALSAQARTRAMSVEHLEHALYLDRSLVKQIGMRRTLFVVPRETLGVVLAGAGIRVAGFERRGLIKDVETSGLHGDGAAWLADAAEAVLDHLSDGRERTTAELRDEVPLLQGSTPNGVGRRWGSDRPVAPRVLTMLSAEGHVIRASNDGDWAVSRPRWATPGSWLDTEVESFDEADGVAGLVELWLRSFGPGTEADLKWWLGSTLALVRGALERLDVVEVNLEGQVGYLMDDDLEPVAPPEPWGALLPSLDPSTMGWYERDWYLGGYRHQLFDSSGNAGPTVWWNGRIVGGWNQDDSGTVTIQLLEDVGEDAHRALEELAEDLTNWLSGRRILPRFPSPLFGS